MSEASPLIPRPSPPTLGHKVARASLAGLLLAAVGAAAYTLRFLLPPVALALVGFYCLKPVVDWLDNRGVPRWAAVLLCLGALIAGLVSLAAALWPGLRDWLAMEPASTSGPTHFELQLARRLADWEVAGRHAYPHLDWTALMAEARRLLDAQRRELTQTLPLIALGVVSHAGTFVLAPIITVFLLLDGARMYRTAVSLIPNRYFETALVLSHRVDQQIAGYLRGTAGESAVVTLLLAAILYVMGMPNALVFASLYGAANVIPLLGPLLGTCAGLLYSLMDPLAPSIPALLGVYGAVYVLDAMFLNPLMIGKNLNVHPLTIILGVWVGGALGGVLGMLASVPLIAVAKGIGVTVWDAHRSGQLDL